MTTTVCTVHYGPKETTNRLFHSLPAGCKFRARDNTINNIGYGAGINHCVSLATTEYVFTINNDTFLTANCIDKLEKFVERTGVDFVCPTVLDTVGLSVYEGGHVGLSGPVHWKDNQTPLTQYLYGCAIFGRRSAFELLPYNPSYFLYCEDMDLTLRAVKCGFHIAHCPEAVIYHNSRQPNREEPYVRYYHTRNIALAWKRNMRPAKFTAWLPWYFGVFIPLRLWRFRKYPATINAILRGARDFCLGIDGRAM